MKRSRAALAVLVASLTLALGFSLAQESDVEALETLQNFVHQYADAINQQDAETFGQLWSEDAKLLRGHSPMVEGREAIVESYGISPENVGTFELSIEAFEAIPFGDMLHGMGTFEIVSAEDKVLDEGKFLGLYKQVDGGLQLYRLSPNSNLPIPEAPAGDSTMIGGSN